MGKVNLISGVEFNSDAMFLAMSGMVLKLDGKHTLPSPTHYTTYTDDTKIDLSGRITAMVYGQYRRTATEIWRAVDTQNNRIFEIEKIYRSDLIETVGDYQFDYVFKYGNNGTFTINTHRENLNTVNNYYIDTARGLQFVYPYSLAEIDSNNFDVIRTVTITTDSYDINDYNDGFYIITAGLDNMYICNNGVPTCGISKDYDSKSIISISSGNTIEKGYYQTDTVSNQINLYTRANKIYSHLHK